MSTKEVSEIPLWFPLANHVLYTTVRRPYLYPTWIRGTIIFHVTTERSSLIYRRARYWRTTSFPLIAGSLKKKQQQFKILPFSSTHLPTQRVLLFAAAFQFQRENILTRALPGISGWPQTCCHPASASQAHGLHVYAAVL